MSTPRGQMQLQTGPSHATQLYYSERASTSHLIRFFDVILGTLMAPPSRLLPVMKMPLWIG